MNLDSSLVRSFQLHSERNDMKNVHSIQTGRVSGPATLMVVCLVQFLTPFLMSSVAVALPAVGDHFNTGAVHLGLVEVVFILAVSLFLLPAGKLGDIYGRKRIFLTGTLVLGMSAFFSVFSTGIEVFILFRFVQGIGAAMITGTSLAILSSVFPSNRRGKAMGMAVASVYLGVSAGPVVGGLLIVQLGWQWIFYFTAGIGGATFLLTLAWLRAEWRDAWDQPFDTAGSLLYILSLFVMVFGMINLASGVLYGLTALAGAAGLLAFLRSEYGKRFPVLDVRLILSNRVLAFSNMATFINYAASFGLTFFFSLYLQYVKGMDPQITGFILVSQPALQAVLSPLAGSLADKIKPAWLSTVGMALCAAGLAIAVGVDAGTGYLGIILILGIMGIGFALFSTPNMLTVMGCVQSKDYGTASSLVSTMRTLGMLGSMTVVTLIFSVHMGDRAVTPETWPVFLSGMHLAFVIFSVLSIVGICFSMARVPESPAPETEYQKEAP